ncbi:enolase C-terminal domain-like protein [Salinisphaera hydrothermalis]|uniref:Mandelate racemase/muconate cycloisomerase n=1 Tax=Salinisphaera hydrothermalis (strain C41B8) TaxID=1304275 RepID=A0A084IPM7_SALHC|nr:enolase C-terminal domain-like protein [Salinisphaera hydrothermalis]KEZ78661.1 mandelate racemase/muconate cycloisomerase [Salinisphaera hydrothermalis C41B8]
MRILEIRDAVAPIASPIRNAFIDFSKMTISVIAIVTDVQRNGEPVIGYGFHSNGRYAQQGILRSRLIPRLLEADPDSLLDETGGNFDPKTIWQAFMHNEKPGGHGDRAVAAGALDMAVWDVVAKVAEQPLWRLLSDRYNDGRHDEEIVVYPGGGYYYPGKEVTGLKDEMRHYDEAGYRVAKMKIGGADIAIDQARIEGALEVLGEGQRLAVDANGKFDLPTAIDYAHMLEPYDLFWYEEPGDPIDYALQAELAGHYEGSMATGENLFSTQDVCNLIRFGGMRPDRDWIQADPALAYGLTEYLNLIEATEQLGWPRRRLMPHGGHQLALNIAAGLQIGGTESYPAVFQPYGGFADDIPIIDGRVRLPDAPGIGMERKLVMFEALRKALELAD